MDNMELFQAITDQAERHLGESFELTGYRPLTGGFVNRAVQLEGVSANLFVKLNRADLVSMFEVEVESLRLIAADRSLKVPAPVCCGSVGDTSFLVLEYIEMVSPCLETMAAGGKGLAALHAQSAPAFGWCMDNWIGSTAQSNELTSTWVEFWRDQRLALQLELAVARGLSKSVVQRADKLLDHLDDFFKDYKPVPSLLHGDLWSGNFGADSNGNPVVFDPAVYFGDREADLAMTELFGGFEFEFYESYNESWPLDAGYDLRRNLYNLYHVLNHFNLFGGSYGIRAGEMVDQLLAELG